MPGPNESMIYLSGPFFHRYVKLQQRVYYILFLVAVTVFLLDIIDG